MKPTCFILGTGPGIQSFNRANEFVCMGVNDVWKYHQTHYLLVMDKPTTFSNDRLQTIANSRPVAFFSTLPQWDFMPGYEPISINEAGGDLSTLHKKGFAKLPRHVDSTFTAVCLAYRLGYHNIILHGVHLKDHPVLHTQWDKIKLCYQKLFVALKDVKVTLCVNDNSPLLEVLPKNNIV